MKSKPVDPSQKPTRASRAEASVRSHRPGDLVRHRGTGSYRSLAGHYGIVQKLLYARLRLGVEWDRSPAYLFGHALGGFLPPGRAHSGWYVDAEDVERI